MSFLVIKSHDFASHQSNQSNMYQAASNTFGNMTEKVIAVIIKTLIGAALMFGGVGYVIYSAQSLPESANPENVIQLKDVQVVNSKHFRKGSKSIYFSEEFPMDSYRGELYSMRLALQGAVICTTPQYNQKSCQIVDRIARD